MNEELERSKKRRKFRDKMIVNIVFIFVGLLVGIVGGVILGGVIREKAPVYIIIGSFTLLVLAFYFLLILHIFIHEVGHMIFGLLSGYQFASIRFFNLMFVKQNGKIRIKRMSIAGTGGQCLMTPPACDGSSPVRLYHLGGCILNLLFSLIAFLCMIPAAGHSLISSGFLMFGICGIGTAVINGIPFRSLGNDGYNAMTLCKRKSARIAVEKTLLANNAMTDNVRIKDMPEEWFLLDKESEKCILQALKIETEKREAEAVTAGENTDEVMQKLQKILSDNLIVSMVILKMNYALDVHDFKQAKEIGRLLMENAELIDLHELSVKADLLYIELIGERRKETIEKILNKELKKKLKMLSTLPSIYRVWYAYYTLYEKDKKKEKEALKKFERLAEHYPYLQDIASEKELIQIAKEKAILIEKTYC